MVRKVAPEKRLLTAAAELQSFCGGRGWRACVIGGLAAIRWGRPQRPLAIEFAGAVEKTGLISVDNRRGGRLVDDVEHIEAGKLAGIHRRPATQLVKIRRSP